MSVLRAPAVLRAVLAADIRVWVEDGDLAGECHAQPSPQLLELLDRFKTEIVELLKHRELDQ